MTAPIFLVGATGTGKSAAALELAREWARAGSDAAILCMDAMQVYRGADIGTSKPTLAERAEFPHGGLDLAEFGASFDVAQYLKHAELFLGEQQEAGRRVIVVGGTGLYFRALTRGLCDAPQGSDELRAELAALTVEQLRARLEAVDPAMLSRIDVSNPRRVTRAIEVMEETGRSLREWQAETPEPLVRNFTAIWIQRSKEELAQRIEARVEAMFSEGWVEEVRGLVGRFGREAVERFAGIGYGKIAGGMQISHGGHGGTEEKGKEGGATELRGQLRSQMEFGNEGAGGTDPSTSLRMTEGQGGAAELKGNICVATRQYAKRQLTWFGRETNLWPVTQTGFKSLREALDASELPIPL